MSDTISRKLINAKDVLASANAFDSSVKAQAAGKPFIKELPASTLRYERPMRDKLRPNKLQPK